MKITRLYTDNTGQTHFANVEMEFELTDYIPPAPPLYLSADISAAACAFMRAPAGWSSDWHPSNGRNLFFVLAGEWEVTASDGEARRFGVGSVLLTEDMTGRGHASRVIGETDSIAAMVRLSD